MSNDGNEDDSWNGIWDVATARGLARLDRRVPHSAVAASLRARRRRNTFGFGIWRDIERYRERSSLAALVSPRAAALSSQLGRLHGHHRHHERTPARGHALRRHQERAARRATTRASGATSEVTIGGDLKFGITPNVTLDATVNPDFGQVEADPAGREPHGVRDVLLRAAAVLRRRHGPVSLRAELLHRRRLQHERRTVLLAAHRPLAGVARRVRRRDNATSRRRSPPRRSSPVGHTSGLSFGLLDAVTPRRHGHAGSRPSSRSPTSRVLRAQQDLRGGEAGISVIATAVNRSLDALTDPFMHDGAYTTGATFRNRFHKQQYELAGQFAGIARRRARRRAIPRTQLNSVHYYQQPGDDLEVDTSAHVAHRSRRAAQVRQVQRRHHALRDQHRQAVGRLRRQRPRLPASRRHARLEHLGAR